MSHSYVDPEQRLNVSDNRSIGELIAARVTRRDFLKAAGALAATAGLPLAGCASGPARPPAAVGFRSVPVSTADAVTVPEGYSARALYAWGDPVGHASGSPVFKPDASNTAAEQALQAGMHHDGIHYFPLPYGSNSSASGLLAMNHEYTDDGLLHTDGFANWSAEKVRKAQNAMGCSVIEVRQQGGQWSVVRPSQYARRITASTPMTISGPAAGHALMRTAADPAGREVLGTINNCAHGYTPWGTYLTCEENWDLLFANSGTLTADHRRNGIAAKGRGYRWDEFDARFDAGKHPNEPHRFGWVVEFDPYDPASRPVKRTALGRFSHEGAWYAPAADGRAVFYMGDDRQFEYLYKFVSRDRVNAADRKANAGLLDHGTLYVAKFNEDGSGVWLPLMHGHGPLTAANGFTDQADVLVRTRAAADAIGGTPMDRPEWIAVHPRTKEVYCTLTNNTRRGADKVPAVNAMNPRAGNVYGHVIRWNETGGDPAALAFKWDLFVLAGDPQHPDPAKRGNIRGDAFGSPDGLWFDDRGLLWIQTDVSTSVLNRGDYERLGNNQMLAADIATGEIRRFLTGPRGCEVTGVVMTPDGRSMFVNIQHPGETSSERNDPAKPQAVSTWPDGPSGGRPRAATVVIRREDGGFIGG
ncbi:MAG: PhoX family protein [Burkholderiales bacterium]